MIMEEERQQILSSASNSRQMNIECQGDSPAQTLNQSQNNVQQNTVEVNSQSVQENLEQVKALNSQQNGQQNASEQYWQSKKNGFIQELNKLLIQGIDLSEQIMFAMPQEILSQKIEDYLSAINEQSSTEQIAELQKKLIKESCLWVVEGKNCNDFDLIKLCTVLQEYTKQYLAQIHEISQKDFDFYRDIIGEWAEKKNYGLKLTKDIQTMLQKQQNEGNQNEQQVSSLKIGLHEIWEVKEIQCLSNNTKIEELDYIRKKRRQHQALIRGLEKLIKAIEKGKGEDEAFTAYQKTVMNPPKMKVQTKINGKSNSQKQNQVDKSIEDNLKKMKIDSGKVTPIDIGEMQNEAIQLENGQQTQQETKPKKKAAKKSNKKTAEVSDQQSEQIEDTQKQSVCESSINNSITQEQSKQIGSKKNQNESKKNGSQQQQSALNNQKDINQKNLLSFFAKKNANNSANVTNQSNPDINSNNFNSLQQTQNKDSINNVNDSSEKNTEINQTEIKTDQQQPAKPTKSLLRRIGGADPRPNHLQTTELIKDTTKNQEVFEIIKQESKKQWSLIKKKKQNLSNSQNEVAGSNKLNKPGRRKILVIIHDFVRQYRNVYFDQQSKIINPRNFLSKDEDLIQYDLDSEDEEQELNAENIENEEDDIDEEDQDDDDSAKQFIVPDGYLSDEGFDSDKEDIFDQKKLTFQNYNFVENANKQGFIFQEKDKAGDVQNFLINYRIKKYDEQENFPLCLKKKTNNSDGQAQPTAVIVWTNERLKQFIRVVHGSYQPKKVLLEQISKIDIMKDVSKNRLEKKFKEIIQKDDKQDGEAIKRWCVHQAIIESLEFEENEMEELKKQRQEEYKSTRQSKKDEKTTTNQQQNSINQNLNNQNNNQQNGGVQQQIKVVGLNIFSSAAPLKKNMNITPIKSVLKSDDEEEKLELEIAEKKQKQRMIDEAESKKQEEEKVQQQQVEKKFIQVQRKKEEVKQPNVVIAEENSKSQTQNNQQQNEQPSRKNSNSINENSNTSLKKQKMLQTTLSFKKS
ncbi:hypothetical protein ABPG74_015051 [Tetrahymena malaccensis]